MKEKVMCVMSEAARSMLAVGLIAARSSCTASGSLYPLSSPPTSHYRQHRSSPHQETSRPFYF